MVKKFAFFYVSTIIVLATIIWVNLHFELYDTSFEFSIPESVYPIAINNIGLFARIVILSLFSFGFLSILLIFINIIVLSNNLASIIFLQGFVKLPSILFYGLIEISYIPLSLCIIWESITIFKIIFKNNTINKAVVSLILVHLYKILELSSIGVVILLIGSMLEFFVGTW